MARAARAPLHKLLRDRPSSALLDDSIEVEIGLLSRRNLILWLLQLQRGKAGGGEIQNETTSAVCSRNYP